MTTMQPTTAPSGTQGSQRIGLLGIFGTGNFGNDGSLESMVRFLRDAAPQEGLVCICTGPEEVRRAYGIDAVPLYFQPDGTAGGRAGTLLLKAAGRAVMWLHALWQLRKVKMVIVPGMGALDDFGVSPFGWPLDLMTWLVLARLSGKTVALASVGAGPIVHPFSRVFFKVAARAAHYRSYRDQISKDYMAGLGLDVSGDPIVADIAFQLPRPLQPARDESRLTVGIGVMTYYGWHKGSERVAGTYDTYVEKMATYASWILDQGHRIRFLIGDETDNKAAQDIQEALTRTSPADVDDNVVFGQAHGLGDVMRQMADIDIAVVTRFHNVVCALKMGKPTISVGYQDKNDALQAAMGLGDFCQHIERLDVERLKVQTERLVADRADFEREILEVRTRFEDELREQGRTLLALIGKSAR